jgi:PII-like signaling protein
MIPESCVLLRVFIGETDRYKGKPLYEAIVYEAREWDLAGATVLRGILGYGADSRIHSSKLLALSDDLPVVVEVVDSEEKIQKLLPFLDEAVEEGLVTLEPITVFRYRHSAPGKRREA